MAKPGNRRVGREAAIQYLFSHELNKVDEGTIGEDVFWDLRPTRPAQKEFAEELLTGLAAEQETVDKAISTAVENYAFHRIAAVDRNILRLATYEILFCDNIPAPVSINEAVEIAKRFGTEDSAGFVNGILDRIRKGPRTVNPED
jgi:N utilization substance protein B